MNTTEAMKGWESKYILNKIWIGFTYDGISGGGNPPAGRPETNENYLISVKFEELKTINLPPGRGGAALCVWGNGRWDVGGGGGPRDTPYCQQINKTYLESISFREYEQNLQLSLGQPFLDRQDLVATILDLMH